MTKLLTTLKELVLSNGNGEQNDQSTVLSCLANIN